jgi:tetratricopeptide (TPR) repeat protein
MASIIQEFLEAAPQGTARVLQLLAAAESLTDEVARAVYGVAPIEGLSADVFLNALHYTDFVAPRNSEWQIAPEVRRELQAASAANPEIVGEAHRTLIAFAHGGDRTLAGSIIPAYLFTDAGQAYHLAAIGQQEKALSLYARAASGPLTGAQWLASRLAGEQEERGVIPPGTIEATFLRAMVLFREGRRQQAEPLFRQVAATDEPRHEVAIAMHILGNLVWRRNAVEAEKLYRRSIKIGEEIGNQLHVAQTLHSLANLIGRDSRRRDEAEGLYRRSIKIDQESGNSLGVAQTLHSLANLIARDSRRRDEAEGLYRRSIEILEKRGDPLGVAQTLHSLANLIGRDSGRRHEAEELFRRSIKIGEEIGNQNHLAQTLRSLAFVVEHRSPQEAEQLLERSLEINERARNRKGIDLVRESLQQLRDRYGL